MEDQEDNTSKQIWWCSIWENNEWDMGNPAKRLYEIRSIHTPAKRGSTFHGLAHRSGYRTWGCIQSPLSRSRILLFNGTTVSWTLASSNQRWTFRGEINWRHFGPMSYRRHDLLQSKDDMHWEGATLTSLSNNDLSRHLEFNLWSLRQLKYIGVL